MSLHVCVRVCIGRCEPMDLGVELRWGQRKCSDKEEEEEEESCGEEEKRCGIHLCAGLTLERRDGCLKVVGFYNKKGKREKKKVDETDIRLLNYHTKDETAVKIYMDFLFVK